MVVEQRRPVFLLLLLLFSSQVYHKPGSGKGTQTDLNICLQRHYCHCRKTWKCQERQTGDAYAEKKETNQLKSQYLIYLRRCSITSDQAGWDFTVEQGTANIHESSAVYKVKTSSLTIVMDAFHWITPRCSSQTSASVLSHSVKAQMENSKIACSNVLPQSLKTCAMLIVDMVGSVELME